MEPVQFDPNHLRAFIIALVINDLVPIETINYFNMMCQIYHVPEMMITEENYHDLMDEAIEIAHGFELN